MGKKEKNIYILTAVLLVVALLAGIGGVSAKYVKDMGWQAEIGSKASFTSDYLKAASDSGYPSYIIYAPSVTFHIDSSSDAGSIGYTVTANDEALTGENGQFTLAGVPGSIVTIEASTSDTIIRTIGAVFQFAERYPTEYSVTDNGTYITLDVYTGSEPGSITVNYGTTLAPDNTNGKLSDWLTSQGSGVITGLDPNAHYAFVFFKIMPTTGKTVSRGELPEPAVITLYQ